MFAADSLISESDHDSSGLGRLEFVLWPGLRFSRFPRAGEMIQRVKFARLLSLRSVRGLGYSESLHALDVQNLGVVASPSATTAEVASVVVGCVGPRSGQVCFGPASRLPPARVRLPYQRARR